MCAEFCVTPGMFPEQNSWGDRLGICVGCRCAPNKIKKKGEILEIFLPVSGSFLPVFPRVRLLPSCAGSTRCLSLRELAQGHGKDKSQTEGLERHRARDGRRRDAFTPGG